jgi:peptidoglycan hydrolase CwlO-like protein
MTPDPGIQRQVDNQGHDITRRQGNLDAFHKDIAGLRTQVNNLSPGMERREDITTALQQDVEKKISALHQGIAKQEATLTAY